MRHALVILAAVVLNLASPVWTQAAPPILPDPKLTPGDVLDVTVKDICVPGYTKKIRNVPESVKRKVYAEYGITHREPYEYEVDHLISLELGGSNSIKNLWPESYLTDPWNARVKDRLEHHLHKLVCEGKLDLKIAQQEIAVDWIKAYKKYIGPKPSTALKANESAKLSNAPDDATNKVWANPKSHIFFKPGCRYYGNTVHGDYMSETDALKTGYRAEKGK